MGKGGGGGGQPTQTTSTAYQTNVPEYARPYVETMLGATQQQLFDVSPSGQITGFQPYKPYSTDPTAYIAPFSPMQQQYFQGTAGLQVPQEYQAAAQATGAAGAGSMGLGTQAAQAGQQYGQMATTPGSVQAYMSPYVQAALQPQLAEMQRQSDIAQQGLKAQAVGAGAFGGSRQALQAAEQERNKQALMSQAIGQGYQSAYDRAMQSMQYGAGLGLQGLQTGLQGYGQGLQAAGQLAGIGGQQLAAQQGILGAQQQAGAMQQAQQQNIINQAIQDYATAQQYPLMQLGFMSNMLRGLPMQATTTQQYQATPSPYSQVIGGIGSLGAALRGSGSSGGFNFAKGGLTSVGYSVGGEIESKLYDMDEAALKEEAQSSQSPSIRRMATRILRQRLEEQQTQSQPSFAGGGIVAFAQPTEENNQSLVKKPKDDWFESFFGDKRRPLYRDPLTGEGPPTPTPEEAAELERKKHEPIFVPAAKSIGNWLADKLYLSGEGSLQDKLEAEKKAKQNKPIEQFAKDLDDTARVAASPAAPPGITSVPAPAQARPTPRPAAPAPAPAAPAKVAPTTAMSLKDYMAEIPSELKAEAPESAQSYLRRKEAYLGPDEAAQSRRRQLMLERANVEDEASRRHNERLGQFFARWGTTPGPVLVAGMESYKKFVEDNISDREVRAKALRDIEKSIHELNAAARAEKSNNFDEAEKHNQKGKEIAQRVNANILSAYGNYQSAQATIRSAEIHKEGTIEAAKMRGRDDKLSGNYNFALKQLEIVQHDIEADRAKAGTPYARATSMYNALSNIPNPNEEQKKMMAQAKAVIDARHAEDEKRMRLYRENVDRAAKAAGYTTITPVTQTAEKATVGGKTYERPANFTDEQWNNYKKAVGAK